MQGPQGQSEIEAFIWWLLRQHPLLALAIACMQILHAASSFVLLLRFVSLHKPGWLSGRIAISLSRASACIYLNNVRRRRLAPSGSCLRYFATGILGLFPLCRCDMALLVALLVVPTNIAMVICDHSRLTEANQDPELQLCCLFDWLCEASQVLSCRCICC